MHIANGVDMHHQGDKRDYQHHSDRKLVNQESDLEFVLARGQPLVDSSIKGIASSHVPEDENRCDKGNRHA